MLEDRRKGEDEVEKMLREAAHAALARSELLPYATFMNPIYQTPLHIQKIGGALEALERGDITRLMIWAPPRHGKSELASGTFPSWCIGRDPSRTVILTGYGERLPLRFSLQNRDYIGQNERWPLVFPDVKPSKSSWAADIWAVNDRRESLIAAGIGGGITGFGAWLLVIDDPIKSEEEAQSIAYRDKLHFWYTNVARTRLTPDGRILLILTRWHEDDLAARILDSEEGKEWEVLHLPAESYGTDPRVYSPQELQFIPRTAFPDPLGRPKGMPLWEDRFDTKFLRGAKRSLAHSFYSLYQGHPSAPEGRKFKRADFRAITQVALDGLATDVLGRSRSWDLAWSEKTSSDNTVGLRGTLYEGLTRERLDKRKADGGPPDPRTPIDKVGMPPVFLVLEGLDKWQLEWDDGSEELIKVSVDDGRDYEILIEAAASQNMAWKSVRRDARLVDYVIKPFAPDKDKELRAKPAMRLASQGCIFILYPNSQAGPDWEQEFLQELGDFPNGDKDDQVDALTQLVGRWLSLIDRLLQEAKTDWSTASQPTLRSVRAKLPFELQVGSRGYFPRVDQSHWRYSTR